MTYNHVLVTTTTDTADEANRLADAIVHARQAACAHVSEIDSTYWWDGEVQHSHEWVIEFKTPAARASALKDAILAAHSYDTPQVIVTPIIDGSEAYLAWLDEETRPRD